MKREKQRAAADREDISEIVALCVAALKKCIELRDGHEDLFSLPVQDREKWPLVSTAHAVVSTACFTAREGKAFRREWEREAKKHGVAVSHDPTKLVVTLLFKLADGDLSSSRNLQAWIDMFKPVDLLAPIPTGQVGTLN